jgi:hypothetical protein
MRTGDARAGASTERGAVVDVHKVATDTETHTCEPTLMAVPERSSAVEAIGPAVDAPHPTVNAIAARAVATAALENLHRVVAVRLTP